MLIAIVVLLALQLLFTASLFGAVKELTQALQPRSNIKLVDYGRR